MALKNRDGSTYKLRGPNPMMKGQETWEGFQVHNMKFEGETAVDDREVTSLESDFNIKDDFAQALAETRPEPVVVEQPSPKVVEIQNQPEPKVIEPKPFIPEPETPRKKSTIPDRRKVFIWCLPATMRDRRDGMYGHDYKTIQYGDPFSFEGVVIQEGDMFIQIWSTVDLVTPGSILYPKKVTRDGVADHASWWRVQDKEAKNNGWLFTGYPSDYTPAFG